MALSTSPEQLQRHCNAFQNDASPVGVVSTIHDEDHYLAETHHKPERNSAHPWSLKDLLDALRSSLIINSHQGKQFQKDPKRYNYIYIYHIQIWTGKSIKAVLKQSANIVKQQISYFFATRAMYVGMYRYVPIIPSFALFISSWSDWVCLNMGYTQWPIGETP